MILRAISFLRSFAATPPPFRRHLAEAIAYFRRGERLALAWAPHLANCITLIDPMIDEIKSRRTVVVLGSGPLFEVPLEALARNFRRVLLVDRIHLDETMARTRRYSNVERVWRDIGGGDEPLAFLDDIVGLDWVISSNVLSDLGREGGAAAVQAHLDGLSSLGCPVTLCVDTDYRIFDRAGTLIEDVELLHGIRLPLPELTWIWEAMPLSDQIPGRRHVHSISAWSDWHSAKRSVFERRISP